jgi:hypothetical protein
MKVRATAHRRRLKLIKPQIQYGRSKGRRLPELDRCKVLVHAEYNRDWYAFQLGKSHSYTKLTRKQNMRNLDSRKDLTTNDRA